MTETPPVQTSILTGATAPVTAWLPKWTARFAAPSICWTVIHSMQTAGVIPALTSTPSVRRNSTGAAAMVAGRSGAAAWKAILRGNDFVCFVPASESLRRWYQNILGTRSVFFHRCITLDAPAPAAGSVSPIAPEDYLRQREAFLTGRPHIEAPEKAFKLQQTYCELYGGGLWQFELNGAPGICLGDREDGKLTLRELLFPDGDAAEAGQMMMQTLGCTSAEVRTPAFWHDGQGELREDCILVPGGGKLPGDV